MRFGTTVAISRPKRESVITGVRRRARQNATTRENKAWWQIATGSRKGVGRGSPSCDVALVVWRTDRRRRE